MKATHDPLPGPLQKALNKYSVSMQRYKQLLKKVPAQKQPRPLARLHSKHHIPSLARCTDILKARCDKLQRLLDLQNLVEDYIPPHKRVLLEAPVSLDASVPFETARYTKALPK
jgi:hypothetical protein